MKCFAPPTAISTVMRNRNAGYPNTLRRASANPQTQNPPNPEQKKHFAPTRAKLDAQNPNRAQLSRHLREKQTLPNRLRFSSTFQAKPLPVTERKHSTAKTGKIG
jgi:hypothetical protein